MFSIPGLGRESINAVVRARLQRDHGHDALLRLRRDDREPRRRPAVRRGRSADQVLADGDAGSRDAAAISTLEAAPELKQQRGLWTDAWRRLIRNRLAVAGCRPARRASRSSRSSGAYVGPLARYDSNDQNYDAGASSRAVGGPLVRHRPARPRHVRARARGHPHLAADRRRRGRRRADHGPVRRGGGGDGRQVVGQLVDALRRHHDLACRRSSRSSSSGRC